MGENHLFKETLLSHFQVSGPLNGSNSSQAVWLHPGPAHCAPVVTLARAPPLVLPGPPPVSPADGLLLSSDSTPPCAGISRHLTTCSSLRLIQGRWSKVVPSSERPSPSRSPPTRGGRPNPLLAAGVPPSGGFAHSSAPGLRLFAWLCRPGPGTGCRASAAHRGDRGDAGGGGGPADRLGPCALKGG